MPKEQVFMRLCYPVQFMGVPYPVFVWFVLMGGLFFVLTFNILTIFFLAAVFVFINAALSAD